MEDNFNRNADAKPTCNECGSQLTFNDFRSTVMSVNAPEKCSKCRNGPRSWSIEEELR